MCRHAAYVGASLRLDRFLLAPSHGLVQQSYRPREMLDAALNVDGFGIGWRLADDDVGHYVNPMPIWSDTNLEHLGRVLASELWIGNVRSATPGLPFGPANTHPFRAGGRLFSHNGYVREFGRSLRPQLTRFVGAERQAEIRGGTDSEFLFAALREIAAAPDLTLVDATRILFEKLAAWLGPVPALLNFLVSDGAGVIATRHALNHASPSLYYGRDTEIIGDGWLVVSEPLTRADSWQPVPDHHIVALSPDREPELIAL